MTFLFEVWNVLSYVLLVKNLQSFAGESNYSRSGLRGAYAEVESALVLISQTHRRSGTVLFSIARGLCLVCSCRPGAFCAVNINEQQCYRREVGVKYLPEKGRPFKPASKATESSADPDREFCT